MANLAKSTLLSSPGSRGASSKLAVLMLLALLPCSSGSAKASPVPPTAPGSVVATAVSSQKITLTWSASANSAGAGSYRVFSGLSPSALTQVGRIAGATTYASYPLTARTTYYYGVEAVDNSGNVSLMSAIVSATTPGPPAAPANLVTTPASTSRIGLTWSAAASGGLPVQNYHVYRGTTTRNLSQLAIVLQASYTDSTLTAPATYYYAVAAADTAGDLSSLSAIVLATAPSAPSAPTGLLATPVSNTTISLTWSAPASGGLPIRNYGVFRGTISSNLSRVATVAESAYTDASGSSATKYYYAVQASDTGGDLSPMSATVSATTPLNIKDFGALGNVVQSIGSLRRTALNCPSCKFTAADVGKPALIFSAGTSGVPQANAIAALVDPHSVTLAIAAVNNVSNVEIQYGTDDYAAFVRCGNAAKNGTCYLPPGRYLANSVVALESSANLRFLGAGQDASVVTSFNGTVNYTFQDFNGTAEFDDFGFDGNTIIPGPMVLYGPSCSGLIIYRCRFDRFAYFGVVLEGMSNVSIRHSLFQSYGNLVGGAIYIGDGGTDMEIAYNSFRYLNAGIIAATGNSVNIHDNEADGGWWSALPNYTGSGSSVNYTPTTLTDAQASFHNVADYATVRVMNPISSGTATAISASQLTDTRADFTGQSVAVRVGDVIRMNGMFGIVTSATSASVIQVEEWLSDTTRLPMAVARPGAYTIYRWVLGQMSPGQFTATSIAVFKWFDYYGVLSTPAAGTRYEVIGNATGNYAFLNLNPSTSNFQVVNNSIRRSWADSISTYGVEDQIIGNTVQDGQDEGITVNGSNHVVSNNHISHQGTSGMFISASNSTFTGNVSTEETWINPVNLYNADYTLYGAVGDIVEGNVGTASGAVAYDRYCIVLFSSSSSVPTINNDVTANACSGHLVDEVKSVTQGSGVVTPNSVH